MKTFPSVNTLKRIFLDVLARVRGSRFFGDRLSVGLLVGALVMNAGTLMWLGLKVQPTDVPVPVRFSNLLSGFDQLGPWYFPFTIGLYALGITFANGIFAYHSFNRSRLVSFFLLASSNVVGAFSLIIASAFGAVR